MVFPGKKNHFGRPKTNFSGFEKWKERKKEETKPNKKSVRTLTPHAPGSYATADEQNKNYFRVPSYFEIKCRSRSSEVLGYSQGL